MVLCIQLGETYEGSNPYPLIGYPPNISLYTNELGDSAIVEAPPHLGIVQVYPRVSVRTSGTVNSDWSTMRNRFNTAKKNANKIKK